MPDDVAPSSEDLARARAELGVGTDTSEDGLRRAFRTLARTHHPDLGGDPERFDRIRRAFALLSVVPAPAPSVARGRPSRDAPDVQPASSEPDRPLDAETRAAVIAGRRELDRGTLAGWLLTPEGRITPFAATSRAPGSRANRIAHALSDASTSQLAITTVGAASLLRVELIARPRRARRALEALRLDGAERGRGWVRTRGSASTRLHQDHGLPTNASGAETAVAAATGGLVALLDRLGWPLDEWRPTAA